MALKAPLPKLFSGFILSELFFVRMHFVEEILFLAIFRSQILGLRYHVGIDIQLLCYHGKTSSETVQLTYTSHPAYFIRELLLVEIARHLFNQHQPIMAEEFSKEWSLGGVINFTYFRQSKSKIKSFRPNILQALNFRLCWH